MKYYVKPWRLTKKKTPSSLIWAGRRSICLAEQW